MIVFTPFQPGIFLISPATITNAYVLLLRSDVDPNEAPGITSLEEIWSLQKGHLLFLRTPARVENWIMFRNAIDLFLSQRTNTCLLWFDDSQFVTFRPQVIELSPTGTVQRTDLSIYGNLLLSLPGGSLFKHDVAANRLVVTQSGATLRMNDQDFLINSGITIDFVDSHEIDEQGFAVDNLCGKLKFTLGGNAATFLAQPEIGIAYYFEQIRPLLPPPLRRRLQRSNLNFIHTEANNQPLISFELFPHISQKAETDLTDSCFRLKTSDQLVRTHFKDTFGDNISLNTTQFPGGLCFRLYASAGVKNGTKSFGFMPDLHDTAPLTIKFKDANPQRRFVLGDAGSQTVALTADDDINFFHSPKAIIDGVFKTLIDTKPANAEDGRLFSTWLEVNASKPYFGNAETQQLYGSEALFNGLTAADGFKPFDQPSGFTGPKRAFPLLPIDQQMTDSLSVVPDTSKPNEKLELESIVSRHRHSILQNDLPDALASDSVQVGETTLPNGIMVVFKPNGEIEIIFTSQTERERLKFKIDSVRNPIWRSLVKKDAFVVLTKEDLVRVNAGFESIVDVEKWGFDLLNNAGAPPKDQPFLIIKTSNKPKDQGGKSLEESLLDVSLWTNDSSLYGLKEPVTKAEQEAFKKRKEVERDKIIGAGLHSDFPFLTVAEWSGVLSLNIILNSNLLPKEINALLKGNPANKLTARHLGFPLSRVLPEGTGFEQKTTSFLGKINYSAPFEPNEQTALDFGLTSLNVVFENSFIKTFDASVSVCVNQLFDLSAAAGGNHTFELKGSYTQKAGINQYIFSLKEPDGFNLLFDANSLFERITFCQVSFGAIQSTNPENRLRFEFKLDGQVKFNQAKAGDFDFPDFSIDFMGLSFPFSIPFDFLDVNFSGLNVTLDPSGVGSAIKGFFSSFPLKLKGFRFAKAADILPRLGFLSITPGQLLKFGFLFDLDLGNLGGLLGFSKINAEVLMGWNGLEPAIGLRLGTFNFNASKLELGLQGIFSLRIGRVGLCSFTRPVTGRQTALTLQDVHLDVLGVTLPPAGLDLTGMIFANADISKVGWYVSLLKAQESDLIPFVGVGNRVGPDPAKIVSVKQGIDHLKGALKPKNLPQCGKEDKPGVILFDLDRGLLVAGQVQQEGLFDFRFLFNDPTLYGGNLEVFELFDIDILYRKLSDSLGVWSLIFRLPIPPFEMGAVSVTLGTLGVDIYTNGDWNFKAGYTPDISQLINVGFTAQFAIFVGQMGFYLAKLSAATTNLLPPTTPGEYGIVQAGFVLKVGIGRDFTLGPLRAAASLSLYGYLEGLLAIPKRNQGPTLFALRGRVGFIAEIIGTVDFIVLKGSVHIFLTAGIGFLYVTNRTLILWIEGEVGVAVQLIFQIRIKIGFVKIQIRIVITFTFRARVRFEYPILEGNDALALLNADPRCIGPVPEITDGKVALPLSYYPELVLKNRPDGRSDVFLAPNTVLYSLRNGDQPLTPKYTPFRNLVEKVVSVTWHSLFGTEPWRGYRHFEQLLTEEGGSGRFRFRSVTFDLAQAAIEFVALGEERFQFLEDIVQPEHVRAVIFPPHPALRVDLSGLFGSVPPGESGLVTDNVDEDYAVKLDRFFDDFLLQFEQRKQEVFGLLADTFSIPFNQYLWNECLKVLVQQAVSLLARKEYDCLASTVPDLPAIALQEVDLIELEGTLSALMRGGLRLPGRGDSLATQGIGELTGQYNEKFRLINGFLKEEGDPTVHFSTEVTGITGSKDDEVFNTPQEQQQWKVWRAIVRKADELPLAAAVDQLIRPVAPDDPADTRFLTTTPFELSELTLPLNRDNAYLTNALAFYPVPETLRQLTEKNPVSARLFRQKRTNATGEILRQTSSVDEPKAGRLHTSIQFRIRPVNDSDGTNPDGLFELFGVNATDAFRLQVLYRSGLIPRQVQPFKVGDNGRLIDVSPADLAEVRVFKNNLAIKTFPTVLLNSASALAEDVQFSPVYFTDMTRPAEVLQILTEGAATNDGGYFISLPLTLRPAATEPAPKVMMMFELAQAVAGADLDCYSFASHLEIGEILPDDSSDTYCLTSLRRPNQAQTVRQYVPRFTNDCFQFELRRQSVSLYEVGVDDHARAYLLNHYDQLVFSLSIDQQEAIISFDKNLPILGQYKGDALLAYQHLTRLRKATEGWGNPYAEIGRSVHLAFAWRNAYGDQLSSPRTVTFRHGYFDQLLLPAEWPGFEIAYAFIQEQSLEVSFAFSPGKPMVDLIEQAFGGNASLPQADFGPLFDQLQRHLSALRLLADQLRDPHVVNGAIITRLVRQDGSLRHIETRSVLDLLRQLMDRLPSAAFLRREDWLSRKTVVKAQLLTHLQEQCMTADHLCSVRLRPTGNTLIEEVVSLEVELLIERDKALINLEVVRLQDDPNVLDLDRVGRVRSLVHPKTYSYRQLQDALTANWNDLPYTLGAGLNKEGQTRLWLINKDQLHGVFQTTGNGFKTLANFSIRPIQTRLWSGVYESKTYSAVDLDQALSNVLAGIETALRPQYSLQLKSLDRYDRLLTVKQAMAEALATDGWVLPVENAADAQKPSHGLLNEFKQQLLKDLGSFYRIDALADHLGPHQLDGMRLLVSSEEPAEQQRIGKLLPGKISRDSYPVLIDFRNQSVQKQSFDYHLKVSHLEWNIEPLPHSPFESSLWIQLIDELVIDPNQTPMVRDCPNLVRRYPDHPSELRHQAGKPTIDLERQVANWDYTLAFRQDLQNGDLLQAEIELENVTTHDALDADAPWEALLTRVDDLLQNTPQLKLFTGTGPESDELYALLDTLPNIVFPESLQALALVDSEVIRLTGRFQDGALTEVEVNKPIAVTFGRDASPGAGNNTWLLTLRLDIFTQRQEAARGKVWITRNQLPGMAIRPEFIYQTEPVGRPDFLVPFLEDTAEKTITTDTLARFLGLRSLQIEVFRRFKHILRGAFSESRNVHVPYGLLLFERKEQKDVKDQLEKIQTAIRDESPSCEVFLRVTLFATTPNQSAAIPLPYLRFSCVLPKE